MSLCLTAIPCLNDGRDVGFCPCDVERGAALQDEYDVGVDLLDGLQHLFLVAGERNLPAVVAFGTSGMVVGFAVVGAANEDDYVGFLGNSLGTVDHLWCCHLVDRSRSGTHVEWTLCLGVGNHHLVGIAEVEVLVVADV